MEEREQMMISVLGSTGSVGEQALDVARKEGHKVLCLSGNKNVNKMEEQAREFNPVAVAMADIAASTELKLRLADTDIQVTWGETGICDMIKNQPKHTVVNAITGKAGLMPTLAAVDAGDKLALANKESLVIAGALVRERAEASGAQIVPVDSEHSAIAQCLRAGEAKEVKKLWLTASGGPFFGYTKEQLSRISVGEALAHPTWKMGAKITIDSATLMNKGFEVIEAVHLFGLDTSKIKVVIHPESIIHSMVEYIDNSVIAQLSNPDMRLPVQYALSGPERKEAVIDELDLCAISQLNFHAPDTDTFKLLPLAYECVEKGGALPAVLNAANEVAVSYFLAGRVPFYRITDAVCQTVAALDNAKLIRTFEGIIQCDAMARSCVVKYLK